LIWIKAAIASDVATFGMDRDTLYLRLWMVWMALLALTFVYALVQIFEAKP